MEFSKIENVPAGSGPSRKKPQRKITDRKIGRPNSEDTRIHTPAPACSNTIRVPELSISNQPCATAYFRPALYSAMLHRPPQRQNWSPQLGVLPDVDIVRTHDLEQFACRGLGVRVGSIANVLHAG
jgi:hypothetical protein